MSCDPWEADVDEVKRETSFDADAEELWRAVSDPAELERWLGEEVELDPVEGGDVRVVVDGEERSGFVEEVEEGRRLVFTWHGPQHDPSRVEFLVIPDAGGSRLVVTERSWGTTGPLAIAPWASRTVALSAALARPLALA